MVDRFEHRAAAVGAAQVTGRDEVGERVVHPLEIADPRLQVSAPVLGQRPGRVAAAAEGRCPVTETLSG